MTWTRGNTLPLASQACPVCLGLGLLHRKAGTRPCRCVLRAIFRACLEQFRLAVDRTPDSLQYAIDFELIAKRTLSKEDWKLFRCRIVHGLTSKQCGEKLGLTAEEVFKRQYQVEEILGLEYATVEPFALYPVSRYFRA